MHCYKVFFLKNVIREFRAIKYALTNAAQICHCWKNGRYFCKAHLATLQVHENQLSLRKSFGSTAQLRILEGTLALALLVVKQNFL